ncbi:hypothetical protein LCGC14_2972380, partial [marine sediment metagenome]
MSNGQIGQDQKSVFERDTTL